MVRSLARRRGLLENNDDTREQGGLGESAERPCRRDGERDTGNHESKDSEVVDLAVEVEKTGQLPIVLDYRAQLESGLLTVAEGDPPPLTPGKPTSDGPPSVDAHAVQGHLLRLSH